MKELLLFGLGIVAGIMNAVAGGGMLLGFPALMAAGLSPLAANITGNLVVFPGQAASALGYRRYIRALPRRYIVLLLPCIVGAAIGALALRHTSNNQFEKLAPGLVLFAVLLFAVQPLIHLHLHRHIARHSRNARTLLLISLVLMPVTIYAGYFGPGFGFIMLAFLGFTSLRDLHQMNGLKNLAGSTIALVSIICLFSTHRFDWPLGLSMAAGNVVGGYGGAQLSQRFSSHMVRIAVIVIGLAAAAFLFTQAY